LNVKQSAFPKTEKFKVHLSHELMLAVVVCVLVLEESDKNLFCSRQLECCGLCLQKTQNF